MIKFYCDVCRGFMPIEDLVADADVVYGAPCVDIVCAECGAIIAYFKVDEEGMYEIVKVDEDNTSISFILSEQSPCVSSTAIAPLSSY